MFHRTILYRLEQWAMAERRKPLIIRGARQVGKTSAVSLFSKKFDQYIDLNLEISDDRKIFERDLPIKDIFQSILLHKNLQQIQGRILLFIDEIQNSPQAIAYLRYFYEKLPQLYIIAAGSLLEVKLRKQHISFPVGRVGFLYMYPLSFKEYLTAMDLRGPLQAFMQVPVESYACDELFRHFHRYVLLGGMPEIIQQYIINRDVASLSPIYHSLITTYMDDVEKYAPDSSKIIRHCIETAPYEAGKRIKFVGFGQSNYKSRDISEALKTLEEAMLLYLLYPVTSVALPATRSFKKSPRLQFLDTGILNFMAKLQGNFFDFDDLFSFYKGIIAEHIIGQELLAGSDLNEKPLFWVREKKQSSAEVDYIIPYKKHLIPVEVKAGKSGTLRSLHQFIDRCSHAYAVRLYSSSFKLTNEITPSGKKYKLLSLPYFLISNIYSYLDWMIESETKDLQPM